jgi:flagellar hook-associated protein 1 FlgK
MSGLFDGMRIAKSGINAHRVMQEVLSQNIANASNRDYTRQEVRVVSADPSLNKEGFLGAGVEVTDVIRIRDELLDKQIRSASSNLSNYEVTATWLNKIQDLHNEPSDTGISKGLTNFWEAWTDLASDPESFAARSNVIAKSNAFTGLVNDFSDKIDRYDQDINQEIISTIGKVNGILEEIGNLNKQIYNVEAGANAQANDLRDHRDAALDSLAKFVEFREVPQSNGMINVMIGDHPAVFETDYEKIVLKPDPADASATKLYWQYGDAFQIPETGGLPALMEIRDSVIPAHKAAMDEFVTTFMNRVNQLYSNGISMDGMTSAESSLGYEALGAASETEALGLVEAGKFGALHFTFYDSEKNPIRGQSILIDATDSLQDIADKINSMTGVNATLSEDEVNDGRLRIELDTTSGENALGETSFAMSNNTGGYDSSGLISLLGFSQTDKSTNLSSVAPVLVSRNLTELQTILGEPNIADVLSADLNLAGNFTINGFETMSEDSPKTNGHHMQQLVINVTTTDSINDIIGKINALTADHGVSASFNALTNKLEITSTAMTDSDGNLVLSAGDDYLRLSFANDYRYPSVLNDKPPEGYTGAADTTGLLSGIQMNTLFTGTDSSTFSFNSAITSADQINSSYKLASGDSSLAFDIAGLQHSLIASNGSFTIGESYQNIVSSLATDIQKTEHLQQNEESRFTSFDAEKDRISGVNLDEELANMLLFQRSYESNARMFSTFDQMIQELLGLSR